jgi:hypothetical protein
MNSSKISIRDVDPAEAETDHEVAYAFSISDKIDRALAEHETDPDNPENDDWISPFSEPIDFASWGRTMRVPHDRSAAFGALLHGLLCRTGDPDGRYACDGSGGTSSIAYDSTYQGGHRAWVDAAPTFVAELAAAGIGLRTAEFHRLIPRYPALRPGSGPRAALGDRAASAALAALIHRHCADPVLVPIGCADPSAAPCPAARWAARSLTRGLESYKLSLIDLRMARLVPRHPGPGDPRDVGKRTGVRLRRTESISRTASN